jgi:DNA-binding CsgD family transcriptional regulator
MTDERTLLVLHLGRKREYLEDLASRIERLRSIKDLVVLQEELQALPGEIRSQIRSFDRLTGIEQNVNKVSSALMRRLHRKYPVLTRTELLVCTYLRVGLTPGQAAEIMFVSRRAVEKHRQSIRAKLGLNERVDLAHWLEDFEHGKSTR